MRSGEKQNNRGRKKDTFGIGLWVRRKAGKNQIQMQEESKEKSKDKSNLKNKAGTKTGQYLRYISLLNI